MIHRDHEPNWGEWFRMCLACLLLILAAALLNRALAKPPPDADPALAPWFHSLHQPDTGISCCDLADCRPTDYRTVADHYEVYVGDEWRAVPPNKVIKRLDNPTGHAIVCWTPLNGIMCFVKGPET
jgi:hypothetical protein